MVGIHRMGKAPYSQKARKLFNELERDERDEMMASLFEGGEYMFDEAVELEDGTRITGVKPAARYDGGDEMEEGYRLWESVTDRIKTFYDDLYDMLH